MAKVVAKAKKRKQEDAILSRIRERYEYAEAIFEIQDDATKDLILAMERTMENMQSGRNVNADRMMRRYIAIRLMTACAKWDIRLAKFKLPKSKCADCGKKVKA